MTQCRGRRSCNCDAYGFNLLVSGHTSCSSALFRAFLSPWEALEPPTVVAAEKAKRLAFDKTSKSLPRSYSLSKRATTPRPSPLRPKRLHHACLRPSRLQLWTRAHSWRAGNLTAISLRQVAERQHACHGSLAHVPCAGGDSVAAAVRFRSKHRPTAALESCCTNGCHKTRVLKRAHGPYTGGGLHLCQQGRAICVSWPP